MGNETTLLNSQSVWKSIVCDAKDRQCFYNADEDENLAKLMLEVKKELNEYDDLLNFDSVLFKSARWKVQIITWLTLLYYLLWNICLLLYFNFFLNFFRFSLVITSGSHLKS